MARDSQPMHEPVVAWFRSFGDPLRNTKAAAQWIAALPTTDAMAIQKEALELVTKFPGARRVAGPAQAEALLRIDARLERILSQLSTQYTTNYQKSTAVETRLAASSTWSKAFAAALRGAARELSARRPNAGAICSVDLVRLVHFKGTDGKFRLFRYGQWIPAQWREFHELYEFARMRGWQREQLAYGEGMFSKAGVSVEQEYLKALLLMRLDSGNFTPDQVEWVAKQVDGWSASLTLVPLRARPAACSSTSRARRDCGDRIGRPPAAACSSPMSGRSTRRSSSGCGGCPSTTTKRPSRMIFRRASNDCCSCASRRSSVPMRSRGRRAQPAIPPRARSASSWGSGR
jgi:hypothetical protein